jgi:hypothetical protein
MTTRELIEEIVNNPNYRHWKFEQLYPVLLALLGQDGESGEGSVNGSYRSYTAILRQSLTAAPVANVLQNDLGFTPNWIRHNEGQYRSTNPEWFSPLQNNKIFCLINPPMFTTRRYMYRINGDPNHGGITLVSGQYNINTDFFTNIDSILQDEDDFSGTGVIIRIYD